MLFSKRWPRSTAFGPQIRTPIAAFSLDLLVNGVSIMRSDPGQAPFASGYVWAWIDEALEAEVLVSPIEPHLPHGMNVEGCVAAIWRVRARQTLSDYSVACTHNLESLLGPGGPCSGEGLEAQEWRHAGKVLTLGTHSLEAMIAHSRQGGRFPERLAHNAPPILDDADLVVYLPNGFSVHPPSLRSLEVIQVQFVASWAPELSDHVSTWYAVDLPPRDVVGSD